MYAHAHPHLTSTVYYTIAMFVSVGAVHAFDGCLSIWLHNYTVLSSQKHREQTIHNTQRSSTKRSNTEAIHVLTQNLAGDKHTRSVQAVYKSVPPTVCIHVHVCLRYNYTIQLVFGWYVFKGGHD